LFLCISVAYLIDRDGYRDTLMRIENLIGDFYIIRNLFKLLDSLCDAYYALHKYALYVAEYRFTL